MALMTSVTTMMICPICNKDYPKEFKVFYGFYPNGVCAKCSWEKQFQPVSIRQHFPEMEALVKKQIEWEEKTDSEKYKSHENDIYG